MNDHLADEVLSAFIDDRLSPDEELPLRAHLATCSACQARLEELRSVVLLLRGLPSVEPPRDFALGPRLVAEPPNLIRLRRWYTVARAGAASLAAAFVFLSVGTLYVDSRPSATPTTSLASKAAPPPDGLTAPNAPAVENATTPATPAQAARAAAPAASPAAAQAPAPAAAQAPAPAAGLAAARPSPAAADAGDQVVAATSVRPLPTQIPTPQPKPLPFATAAPASASQADTAAPLRAAAAIVGVLTVVALFVAVVMRHRLRAANLHTE